MQDVFLLFFDQSVFFQIFAVSLLGFLAGYAIQVTDAVTDLPADTLASFLRLTASITVVAGLFALRLGDGQLFQALVSIVYSLSLSEQIVVLAAIVGILFLLLQAIAGNRGGFGDGSGGCASDGGAGCGGGGCGGGD